MNLSQQTIRRLLQLTALGLLLVSGLLVWQAFRKPTIQQAVSEIRGSSQASTKESPNNATRDMATFEPLLDRSLRAPLYDPPPEPQPPPPAPVRKQPPPAEPKPRQLASEYRLVGTMIETDESIAILVDDAGDIRLAKLGEVIELPEGEGKIDSIQLELVTIVVDDERFTLEIPK